MSELIKIQTTKTYNKPVADKVDSILIVLWVKNDKKIGKIIPKINAVQRNIPSYPKINS